MPRCSASGASTGAGRTAGGPASHCAREPFKRGRQCGRHRLGGGASGGVAPRNGHASDPACLAHHRLCRSASAAREKARHCGVHGAVGRGRRHWRALDLVAACIVQLCRGYGRSVCEGSLGPRHDEVRHRSKLVAIDEVDGGFAEADRGAREEEPRAAEREGLVLAALAGDVDAVREGGASEAGVRLSERLPEEGGGEAQGGDLARHGHEARRDHASQGAGLLAAPQQRDWLQAETGADVLNTSALVVGQQGAHRHGGGPGGDALGSPEQLQQVEHFVARLQAGGRGRAVGRVGRASGLGPGGQRLQVVDNVHSCVDGPPSGAAPNKGHPHGRGLRFQSSVAHGLNHVRVELLLHLARGTRSREQVCNRNDAVAEAHALEHVEA
mmetsp:Transcript_24390/g.92114  ORF Transcript_24390/g.92114 Transcript_24390/m.92114 type:complete len:384 (+) Transcript_24390:826-1977(+)